jgi:hypothetical protein
MKTTATITAIAELFRKDRATLQRACRDLKPVSTKGRVNEFRISEVVAALIAAAVSGVAGVGAEDTSAKAFAKERSLKMKQQRIALEHANDIEAGKYVLLENVMLKVDAAMSVMREVLLGLPGSCAYDLAASVAKAPSVEVSTQILREKLDTVIRESMEAISSFKFSDEGTYIPNGERSPIHVQENK